MKRIRSISSIITLISLLPKVVWLSTFFAAPSFVFLGQFKVEDQQLPGAKELAAAATFKNPMLVPVC
jgi:hypothetical protein